MKRLLLLVFFLATIQVSKAQDVRDGDDLSLSVDVFSPQRIKPGATYQQSFPVKAGQAASLQIQLRKRFSIGNLLKAGAPVVAATAYGLLKQRVATSSLEGARSHTNLAPYLAGGALASGASFALTPKRNRAYLELTYRNMAGVSLRTEGHWINVGKPSNIDIRNPVDGWLDVTVIALKKQALEVKQLNFVAHSEQLGTSQIHEMSTAPPASDAPADTTETKPKKSSPPTGGAQPNKEAPCTNCPINGGGGGYWLPEVVVVGHYTGDEGGGDTGQTWSDFVGGFQGDDPGQGGDPTYFSGAMPSNNGDAYTGQLQSTPSKSLIQTQGMRVTSFCNARQNMWDWSYGNNNTNNTVETAGFMLADGTFFQLPWQANTYRTTNYRINDIIQDVTGVWEYQVQVNNGILRLLVKNKISGFQKVIQIVGYVHTHPYTGPDQNGVNYDIYNPTLKNNPDANDPNDFGDWQLSHDFGIPGYIVTKDKVVCYMYDSSANPAQKVTGVEDNKSFCNPLIVP